MSTLHDHVCPFSACHGILESWASFGNAGILLSMCIRQSTKWRTRILCILCECWNLGRMLIPSEHEVASWYVRHPLCLQIMMVIGIPCWAMEWGLPVWSCCTWVSLLSEETTNDSPFVLSLYSYRQTARFKRSSPRGHGRIYIFFPLISSFI